MGSHLSRMVALGRLAVSDHFQGIGPLKVMGAICSYGKGWKMKMNRVVALQLDLPVDCPCGLMVYDTKLSQQISM